MPAKRNDMDLLRLACRQGLISEDELQHLREEHTQGSRVGRAASPTRLAIERGLLSEDNARDLETDAWIQSLPRQLDDYQLVRLLGRGGMAVVFEAQDVSLGKVVALKVLLPEFSSSESYLSRFHREARIAAKLTHPNTVQVFAAGEAKGIEYLIMEFVDGETLSTVIKNRRRIPEPEALDMIVGITGALEEAGDMGIVHRDIKPANIMISKWGVPKLADFGIAKEFGDITDRRLQVSLTLGVVGTPHYMSPEQAKGARHLDFRSDIYSLGSTLYHIVVGELPFEGDTPQEAMVRVISEAPRPPRSAYSGLSNQTAAVIGKMMAKDPDNRYQSYEELRADLIAARDGNEVSVDYDEASELMKPDEDQEDLDVEPLSLFRALAVAGAVVIIGIVLLWLTRGCAG